MLDQTMHFLESSHRCSIHSFGELTNRIGQIGPTVFHQIQQSANSTAVLRLHIVAQMFIFTLGFDKSVSRSARSLGTLQMSNLFSKLRFEILDNVWLTDPAALPVQVQLDFTAQVIIQLIFNLDGEMFLNLLGCNINGLFSSDQHTIININDNHANPILIFAIHQTGIRFADLEPILLQSLDKLLPILPCSLNKPINALAQSATIIWSNFISSFNISSWNGHVDFFFQVTMQKCCLNINCTSLQSFNKNSDQHKSECNIVDDRRIIVLEIHTRDLTVTQCHQSCTINTIPLDLEDPFASHQASAFRDVSLWHVSPNFSIDHITKFLSN
mmetsp:Transcript_10563/g.23415  ORF Transcript_10563/g.23415 Transcript_10563/m.23415 type:complete len:328 (-) Transcript_10563:532-1515(-)